MHTETVSLKENSYPIFVGEGSSFSLETFTEYIPGRDIAIITNEVVAPLYLKEIADLFSNKNVITYILPDGEQEKKLKTVHKIIDFLLDARFGRDATLIALGGGVVGDITGFTASIFMRGISLIQIPTTLLAQVDASIGGKTGVNHKSGKNLIGSFYQPKCVVCDKRFLHTLSDMDISDGLIEAMKCGLIYDADFFNWLSNPINAQAAQGDSDEVEYVVKRSCQIKAEIVSKDEKEQSIRALLNFGHTFGHAIETLANYEISHGRAVAHGIKLASKMSHHMDMITEDELNKIETAIFDIGYTSTCVDPDIFGPKFLDVMKQDKKVKDGNIQLVLLRNIGEAFLTSDYDQAILEDLIKEPG
jgi:3-dehydroquinate synthase